MILSLFILFGCLAVGEALVWATGAPLPGSIVGMLLLTVLLQLGWVRLEWVRRASDFLVAHLGFFFVPPGVALMCHFGLIGREFAPIIVSTVVSSALVLWVTGWVHQWLRRHL